MFSEADITFMVAEVKPRPVEDPDIGFAKPQKNAPNLGPNDLAPLLE